MSNHIAQSKARLIDSLMLFSFFQKTIGRRWVSQWRKKYILAEQELSILPQILENDAIIFDIGANRGELSFFFATSCSAKKVFSFEPQYRMFGILQGVAENIENIAPINIALSDSVKEKILRIPLQATGRYTPAGSFEQFSENNLKEEKVKVDTLDNFVVKNNIIKIDFIKCDTEGHELAVFKGAQKTLTALRPLLYVEVKGSTKDSLFDLLKNNNYHPYQWNCAASQFVAVKNGRSMESENYYFFPDEKEERLIKILERL
ncbi:MAG: methyltransferase [Parcubacteria group bacterium Athens0714_16]|nr:MAG: methyltransferase [Parcubacteria group bacterium Athens0714_16]